jgi:2-haloacid dehalogenase
MMARVCVFDLEETLLDLRGLDGQLGHSFVDAAAVRRRWFAQLVQSACVGIITNRYADFTHLADAALQIVAAQEDVTLNQADRHELLGQLRGLPPHADVHDALERLRAAGLRLAVLTNATSPLVEAQLAHAKLEGFFEGVFSADVVRRLKPAPEPYHLAAQQLGVSLDHVRLISAHAWDIAGALHAGCAAAFVQRPGLPFDPLIDPPDVVGEGLTDVAEHLIDVEGRRARESAHRAPQSERGGPSLMGGGAGAEAPVTP